MSPSLPPSLPPGGDVREATLAVGRAAQIAAGTANVTAAVADGRAAAARWPTGPGPITHGTSPHMTRRCREEAQGPCAVCRAGDARRVRESKARRRQRQGKAT